MWNNKTKLREKILRSRELTAMEKRYLEGLVNASDCIPECKEGCENLVKHYESENAELKRLLRLAVDDFQTAMLEEKCKVCGLEHCDYDEICKWQHNDEAMELLEGTDNAEN